MDVSKMKEICDIDVSKFNNMVQAIGPQTIQAIALAGPEMQVKLLKSLGLKSTLITDGNTPINLFNTASGLVGGVVPGIHPAPDDDYQPQKRARSSPEDD